MELESRPIDVSHHCGLLIPSIKPLEISNEDTLCRASLAGRHAKLYVAADLSPAEDALKKATLDVASVMKCFPAVTSEAIILAMAAWYTTLCHIDDAVENLESEAAQLALAHAIYILRNASWCNPPMPGETNHEGDTQDMFMARVLSATVAYCSRLQDLLPCTVQSKLRAASIDTLDALALEHKWRHRSSINESAYLSIRTKTIGVTPFFLLVRYNFDHDSSFLTQNVELESLMSDAELAIGLQNDLIGLSRDIEKGERFNYILRLESPSLDEREARTLKAVNIHNNAIRSATATWENLKAGSGASAQACADSLMKFVERHYLWASTSKRYQCHPSGHRQLPQKSRLSLLVMRALLAKSSMRKNLGLDVHYPDNGRRKRKASLQEWTIRMELKQAMKSTKETSLAS
ncbi:hypothetical protein CLAFUW4_12624 [Fulvia fulva]|uniref:Terpenoid synthase n=1 Tax=Passalora fulva TaxID=5499 RepID=A0A9Q8USC4_PASFU|nr:uncharacterized protein CLAFUR5_11648 [Fulvia fulva]KAK4618712.1 hypothetical protein CLAFUR0_12640 [Fulvia fulva]UJO20635.1 hypothetical protein CLAFUR5_11648 [Fulvia fulva]WPV18095.1 hypothetical protein CLAFUW4_12624 [Fulvia fulva]WPV33491.1 hypothetical protein CLAFUW7_12631 [Fulvia fulva]